MKDMDVPTRKCTLSLTAGRPTESALARSKEIVASGGDDVFGVEHFVYSR